MREGLFSEMAIFVRLGVVDRMGSVAIYRPQADCFGGQSDGRFGAFRQEAMRFQVVTGAGDT